jgi:hypothetical protein
MRAALFFIALFIQLAGFSAHAEDSVENDAPQPKAVHLTVTFNHDFPTLTAAKEAIETQEKVLGELIRASLKTPLLPTSQSVNIQNTSESGITSFDLNLIMTYEFSDASVTLAIADALNLEPYTISVTNELDGC